jgi:hypothetical protein
LVMTVKTSVHHVDMVARTTAFVVQGFSLGQLKAFHGSFVGAGFTLRRVEKRKQAG